MSLARVREFSLPIRSQVDGQSYTEGRGLVWWNKYDFEPDKEDKDCVVVDNEALSGVLASYKVKIDNKSFDEMIAIPRAEFDECAVAKWATIKKKRNIYIKVGKECYEAVSTPSPANPFRVPKRDPSACPRETLTALHPPRQRASGILLRKTRRP